MATRHSWVAWSISAPEMRQIPGRPMGDQEPRVYITCPSCDVRLDVAHASATTNKAHHCGKHLKVCTAQASTALVPTPAPSRVYVPKSKVHEGCRRDMDALREEVRANNERHDHAIRELQLFRDGVFDVMLSVNAALKPPITVLDVQSTLKQLTHVSTAIVPVAVPTTADAERDLAQDRQRSEHAGLKRKLEVSERDRDAQRAEIQRLQSGSELRTFKRLNKVYIGKCQARDKCLHGIDRVIREEALPSIAGSRARGQVVESLKVLIDALKADDHKLGKQQQRVWAEESDDE